MMILTIAWREFRNLFLSPLAWCVLAVIQIILGFFFFFLFVPGFLNCSPSSNCIPGSTGVTDFVAAGLFGTAAVVFLLVVPIMSMGLIAEERRIGTLKLLMSAPISMTDIALGKYLGLLLFLLSLIGLLVLMPLSLAFSTHLDYGKLAAGVLGLTLLLAAFAAVGLFMSSLTKRPVVAGISGFGVLLLLWILQMLSRGDLPINHVLRYLSIVNHYDALLSGVFRTDDVIYYLLVIALFLAFSIRRLDSQRLQH
jgi:ABC-2 type transport system permease protein